MTESAPAADQPTAVLAAFAAQIRYQDLPPDVVKQVKRCLLDYLGIVIGATDEPTVQRTLAAIQELGGNPQAAVLGTSVKTSVHHAALVNGIASNTLDYDDTHLPTIIHPTGPAMSAALAVGEWQRVSGQELIAAFAAGFEVECRVGLAVHPEHYAAGWHITGTVGTFGGAAAAGRLLKLNPRLMSWALGMAGSLASGVREQFGSMAKSLHIGHAAAGGVLSAILARHGFDATEQILEGPRGFAAVLSTGQHLERLTDRLGRRWEFDNTGFKPYACGVVTHPVIDGVRQLREREQLTADQVERIEARVHPLVLELTGRRAPRDGLEAKLSVYHCAALALLDGACGPAQFNDEAVHRPEVIALRDRVQAEADPTLVENQAEVVILLHDGRRLVERVQAASGSPQQPLSDAELRAKLHELVWAYLPRWKEERLLELVDRLETLEDVAALAELLEPTSA